MPLRFEFPTLSTIMGFISRLFFTWKMLRIRDPQERQGFAIEWMVAHPADLARERETALEGVRVAVARAFEERDKGILVAGLYAQAWLAAMGTAGGIHIDRLNPRDSEHAGILRCTAFVVAMVQPFGELKEDAEAGERRFAGSHFAKQMAWFSATYPALDGTMAHVVAQRDKVAAAAAQEWATRGL